MVGNYQYRSPFYIYCLVRYLDTTEFPDIWNFADTFGTHQIWKILDTTGFHNKWTFTPSAEKIYRRTKDCHAMHSPMKTLNHITNNNAPFEKLINFNEISKKLKSHDQTLESSSTYPKHGYFESCCEYLYA